MRDIKAFAELFDGLESGKVSAQDKEQAVAGIGDNDIRKDGMGMLTAVTEYTHDAEILLLLSSGFKINDGSAVIIVDMAVSGVSTDGTVLQLWLKLPFLFLFLAAKLTISVSERMVNRTEKNVL